MNMQVSIHLRGPLALKSSDSISIIFDGPVSLFKCLQSMLKNNPALYETWTSPEQITQECLVLVNDVDVGLTGNLNTRLEDGDVVIILPLIHGG